MVLNKNFCKYVEHMGDHSKSDDHSKLNCERKGNDLICHDIFKKHDDKKNHEKEDKHEKHNKLASTSSTMTQPTSGGDIKFVQNPNPSDWCNDMKKNDCNDSMTNGECHWKGDICVKKPLDPCEKHNNYAPEEVRKNDCEKDLLCKFENNTCVKVKRENKD